MKNFNLINDVLFVVAFLIFISILLAWPVQLLWNYCLAPAINGIQPIGFWQSLGINILFSILFKSSTSKK
jgi:hypothetical protein